MATNRADLAIYQGDDWGALVTLNGGLPLDVIDGYTALAQIRECVADDCDDVAAVIDAQVQSPYVLLGLQAAQTVLLCGEYVWDLQITSPEGGVSTILAGKVRVTSEVSRAAAGSMRLTVKAVPQEVAR